MKKKKMPYSSNSDLPKSVRDALPDAAQSTFRTIINAALEQYKGDESKAMATAWAGLKNAGWKKDKDGKWSKVAKFFHKNAAQRYTLGVVYEPNELDTDVEWATAKDIEKAAWDFMRLVQGGGQAAKQAVQILQNVIKATGDDSQTEEAEFSLEAFDKASDAIGIMHSEWGDKGEIVECYVAPADMEIDGENVKKGSWLLGVVWSEAEFKKIESGDLTGYSMGGMATKVVEIFRKAA